MKINLIILSVTLFCLKYNINYCQGNLFNTYYKYGKKEVIVGIEKKNFVNDSLSSLNKPVYPKQKEDKIEIEVSNSKDLIIDEKSVRSINNNSKFSFRPPLKKLIVTSKFGNRIHPIKGVLKFHAGVDYKAYYEPVYVIAAGVVEFAGQGKNEGNYVVIRHSENSKSIYCHLSALYVTKGQRIITGHIIGKSGNTGRSTGPHLHFAVKYNGRYLNPSYLFK